MRPRGGLPVSAEIQPDYIAFDGKRRPERIPHPAIGDASMKKHDRQVTAWARSVVGNTRGRMQTRLHGIPFGDDEVGLVDRTTDFLPMLPRSALMGESYAAAPTCLHQPGGPRTKQNRWLQAAAWMITGVDIRMDGDGHGV